MSQSPARAVGVRGPRSVPEAAGVVLAGGREPYPTVRRVRPARTA
jgi:hypothetical protein